MRARVMRKVKVSALGLLAAGVLLPVAARAAEPAPVIALDWETLKAPAFARIAAGNLFFAGALGKDGKAWLMEGQKWRALTLPPKGRPRRSRFGSATVPRVKPSRIAAAADGSLWAVTRGGKALRLEGGQTWKPVPGTVQHVAVGSAQQVWGLQGRALVQYTNGSWRRAAGPGLSRLSVASDGTMWGVGPKGEVYRRQAKTEKWERMPGTLTEVSVGKAGLVAGIGSGGRVWRWTEPAANKGEVLVAARVGSCGKDRRAYGIIKTTGGDCRRMGGRMNGNPKGSDWTDCHLDWCVARPERAGYSPARPGTCRKKVAYGGFQTIAGECRALGGKMNGDPQDGDWTLCHLDWCDDGQPRIVAAKPGTCGRKVAYGPITTTGGDCRKLGGRMNKVLCGLGRFCAPRPNQWAGCHLDWCEATAWRPVPGVHAATSVSLTPAGTLFATDRSGQSRRLSLSAWASIADRAAASGAEVARKIGDVRARTLAAAKGAEKAEADKVRAEAEVQVAEFTKVLAHALQTMGLYYPARVGSCGAEKRGYGAITMTARDCRRMGGRMNMVQILPGVIRKPKGGEWTGCYLDWCLAKIPAGGYSAGRNNCRRQGRKVGYGVVTMPVTDCRRLGGKMNGNPPATVTLPIGVRMPNWTGCHLDWCRSRVPTVVAAGPGWCPSRTLAYGHVKMTVIDCRSMGGNYNGEHPDNAWIDCHFEWCRYRPVPIRVDPWVRKILDAARAVVRSRPLIPRIQILPDGRVSQPAIFMGAGFVFQEQMSEGAKKIRAEWNRRAAAAGRRAAARIVAQVERQLAAQGMSLDAERSREATRRRVWDEARRKLGLPVGARPKPPSLPRVPGPAVPAGGKNLARGKPATQSSTSHGGVAARAVDGNISGQWGHNSVTHTGSTPMSWWQVDLGAVRQITGIRIWNRTDCCSERLSNFHVLVSERPFPANPGAAVARFSRYHHGGRARRMTPVKINARGRYVRIQLAGRNPLSLAEVEVLGR